jgi:hypothetical protein
MIVLLALFLAHGRIRDLDLENVMHLTVLVIGLSTCMRKEWRATEK